MTSSPVLADQYGLSPEEELEHKDFIEYLQRIAAGWPKVERDVFELHFLEGFAADEVAMIENLTPEETAGTIGVVQLRVRQLMRAAAGLSVERSRVAVVGSPAIRACNDSGDALSHTTFPRPTKARRFSGRTTAPPPRAKT